MKACLNPALAVMLTCLCAGSVLAEGSARPELVLFWDDGEADGVVAPGTGTRVAAAFEAPSSTTRLVGMQLFVADDGVTDPLDPSMPTTAPFVAYVWRSVAPGFIQPGVGSSGYVPFEWNSYPEGCWVEFCFPTPFDVGDPAVYWDGWFFIGVKWMEDANPQIGLDLDDPGHDTYWTNAGSGWSQYGDGDVLLRAVVRDSSGTAVIDASWAAIKDRYR